MITLTRSLAIAAPAATVWEVLADYRRDPTWRTGVVSMEPDTPGLPRAGTRVHEVLRLGGRTNHIDSVVDEVDPGVRVAWHTTGGADVDGYRLVEPHGESGCRVTLAMRIRPHGAERLMAPAYRWMLGRNLEGDLGRLRDLVTAAPAGPLTQAHGVR